MRVLRRLKWSGIPRKHSIQKPVSRNYYVPSSWFSFKLSRQSRHCMWHNRVNGQRFQALCGDVVYHHNNNYMHHGILYKRILIIYIVCHPGYLACLSHSFIRRYRPSRPAKYRVLSAVRPFITTAAFLRQLAYLAS